MAALVGASNHVGSPDLASVRFALSCVFSPRRRLPDGDFILDSSVRQIHGI
jgi:hypothetical protein